MAARWRVIWQNLCKAGRFCGRGVGGWARCCENNTYGPQQCAMLWPCLQVEGEETYMLRQIVTFDKDRCNGCGLCVHACHEGAIGLVGGKATLLRDDFCDGMGDCLPACPADAIRFEQREALPYDEAAVQARKAGEGVAAVPAPNGASTAAHPSVPAGAPVAWPGFAPMTGDPAPVWDAAPAAARADGVVGGPESQLAQWPCQIKLVPVNAPFLQGARLLVAADCTAFAHPDFHRQFMAGRVTLVGCPKLDAVDYSEKLAGIFALNDVRDVLVARMDVPCCGGIQRAVAQALASSGKRIPARVVTIARDGRVLAEEHIN